MKKLVAAFILVVSLFLPQLTYACAPQRSSVSLACVPDQSFFEKDKKCLNKSCTAYLEKKDDKSGLYLNDLELQSFSLFFSGKEISLWNTEDGIIFSDLYLSREDKLIEQEFLGYLDDICTANIEEIKPILVEEIDNSNGSLSIVKYSSDREAGLIKEKKSYLDCIYQDYKKAGDWLLIDYSAERSYCYPTYTSGGTCPMIRVSYINFFGFLLTNLNVEAIPYLIVYLLFFVIIGMALIYLARRHEIGLFFSLKKFNLIATLLFAILMFLPFTSLFGVDIFIEALIIFYIFTSLIKYIHWRLRKK